MQYAITHVTRYRYSDAVLLSHHVARLEPRALPWQRTISHALEISPAPTLTRAHRDFHGNAMTFFLMEGEHHELVVTARSEVAVERPAPPGPGAAWPWEAARDHERLPPDVLEYVFESPAIRAGEDIARFARPSFGPQRPFLDAVTDLMTRIHRDFTFDPRATTVATPLAEVLRLKRGVCQDFSHLAIGAFRSMGLAARYVSGYLETQPPPGRPRLTGADSSHAWVSVYAPEAGWVDLDPTNGVIPGETHVTLGWGRDFHDVSPLRGVMLGGGGHELSVGVDVLRVGS